MLFESNLGCVVCDTTLSAIDNIVAKWGLRARETEEPNAFDIFTGGRSMLIDPAVEQQLLSMAVEELEHASEKGLVPAISFRPTHHRGNDIGD